MVLHLLGVGHYRIEAEMGDPASARLVPATAEEVEAEARWHNIPLLVPAVPRPPDRPDCPVRLDLEGLPATVHGRPARSPGGVAYRAVKALVEAYPGGLSGRELNAAAGSKNACAALQRLGRSDPLWARALWFPRLFSGATGDRLRYRIVGPREWGRGANAG